MSGKVDKSEQFSGKSDGISFEKLDEKILSWGRSKFGDKYATMLWKDELTDLTKLDLKDELDAFEWDMHCTMVYDVLCYDSAKYADGLFETTRFWTVQYQLQCRQRLRERMYCYLETVVKGEAARQIKKLGVRKMAGMRDYLFRRFGAGQPEILEERVRKYHLGMPDPKTGEAFPLRCDMEAKLDALEAEREYLVEMCPREQRDSYEDGKESTLVRIILRHRPKEYDSAVKTVMDLHRFRLYGKGGDLKSITNLEDNSRVIYNSDWLPNYEELRQELISSYLLQKRRREELNQDIKKGKGHPTLPVLQGFDQPGPQEKTCYGCGEKGHFKGDPDCKAGPNDIWSGAPEGFKVKAKNGGKGKSKKGKGRGRGKSQYGDRQRSQKKPSDDKIPCKFFNSGNGYCKWGDNCRHSHDGKKGGKRKSSLVLSKKEKKKAKKEIAAMVISDLKSTHGNKESKKASSSGNKDEDDDGSLYNLVRGKSTMMVQRLDDTDDEDFVPRRRVVMMISSDESSGEEFVPIRDHKIDEQDLNKKNKSGKEQGLVREKSEFDLNDLTSQSKTTVSSSSPFTRATRRPRFSSEAKLTSLQSSSEAKLTSSRSPALLEFDPEEHIGPRARHLIETATKRLKVTEDFIANMSKYLNQQSADIDAQQKRRDENESRRKFELLGVEDPKERAEVKRAHHDERVQERLADQRAEHAVAQAEERAPKRRKGRSLLKPLTGKDWLNTINDPRNDEEDKVFWTDLARYPDSDCNSEERKEILDTLSHLPQTQRPRVGLRAILAQGEKDEQFRTVTKSQRKARMTLVDKNRVIAAEIKVLETRKAARWNELVENNTWMDYEEDPEVKALDRVIEEKSRSKVKVWTALRERNRRIEAGLESEESSSDSDRESSSGSENEEKIETKPQDTARTVEPPESIDLMESMFLMQMKKGDNHLNVKFVRGNEETDWEGPFDLATSLGDVVSYIKKTQPQESSSSVEATTSTRRFKMTAAGKVGLTEILESERKRLAKESTSLGPVPANESLKPKFVMGHKVYYFIDDLGNEKWHTARVIGYYYPEKWSSQLDNRFSAENEICYRLMPDRDNGEEYDVVYRRESKLRDWSWARPCYMTFNRPAPLVPLDLVGIDTCSALSVSSRREDFLWLDTTQRAKSSVILRGVGGDSAKIGGRGPMVIKSKDSEGNEVLVYDPKAVYMEEDHHQAEFRIFGQLRLKRFGYNLVQRDTLDGGDILSYQNGKTTIPLISHAGILALQTYPLSLTGDQQEEITKTIDSGLNGGDGLDYCIRVSSSLLMNEAYLTDVEAARLHHWRIAHRSVVGSVLNENCPVCTEGKKKTGHFKRNYEFMGSTRGKAEHYWRLYVDGYGGQHSMGDLSYQGGIGGFVFACPRGSVKVKLYGSTAQFPAILFQVLQEVESEGYVTREIYVDTHSVNLSKAVEEVAAMFRVKIIPISAGTPQEMAYAESAVRVIGQMSRTLMCGAPHLPPFCWGLGDLYAGYIHDFLPQAKTKMSPYEDRTGREPNLDVFFVKVFGAPCQYAPIEGGDHKRSKKTEWGWFVGMQMPMCLVLRPEDDKIISVSRKKIIVHEEFYAKYDQTLGETPLANFAVPILNLDDVKTEMENLENIKEYKEKMKIPDHVLSIKSLSDYKRHPELNESTPPTQPSQEMLKQLTSTHQPITPGENTSIHVPEHETWNKEFWLDKIKDLRMQINQRFDKGGKVEAIVKALKKAEAEASNEADRRDILLKRDTKRDKTTISKENIISSQRKRDISSVSGGVTKTGSSSSSQPKNKKKRIEVGDRVKIKTKAFGQSYAKGKPIFTYGFVKRKKGDLFDVFWDAGDSMMTHKRHLAPHDSETESDDDQEPLLNSRLSKETILPILAVGAALSQPNPNGKDNWPRDFYEALLRDDWRDWVQAVKNETDSWGMLEASTEVNYDRMERGASIIPLGELFSVKRNGKYKFRQYALGNMLKEGKDYGETFSSTVSGDGVRWFCSLACACKKEIRGWDATTGYLQTQQRVTVYAYLPSHHGYSELSFEELAPFRKQLKDMEREEGLKSVKDFARKMKKERRDRPKTVLRLNKSVYGIPDAGQSFSMFMQGLHLKHCKMIQSEMDPCVFYKILEDENGKVASYLVVITWVDDCRFFGTADLVKEYEATISKNCKCTLEGISREFVSIQINHKVEEGVLELTQEDYWIKAVERFKSYLPEAGPKERKVPLSPADEKLLVEPNEKEMKEAEHLPYASLLGVIQYPSSFTKLEMRYAMSVLSRHRTKWGLEHFKILIKALEYGFSTRHLGLRYNGNLPDDEKNVLEGFADSALTAPRSQGCRLVTMNQAAISLTSKKHTTTDDSTAAAELTECHLCACDVVGFRELMKEIGLEQVDPTIIWQDNQAAIQIAMNRGSLSKKTRAMDIRVFSVRNKIEDMKVVPIYLKTDLMLADIGTKALEPGIFISLRDQLCGYAAIVAKKIKVRRNNKE